MKFSKKELKESTHTIYANKSPTSTSNKKTVYYDEKGNEIVGNNHDNAWAYKTYNKGVYDCYVKVTSLNNLWSKEKGFESSATHQASIMGVDKSKMLRVPREAFDNYIVYLQTGQSHYLKLAEREI